MHSPTIVLLLITVLAGPLCASPHRGPVTDIIAVGGKVFSCSQAGIFVGTGNNLQLVAEPAMRAIALSFEPSTRRLFFSGGEPAQSGSFGALQPSTPGAPVTHKVARDLVYDIALGTGRVALACADGTVLVSTGEATNRQHHPAHTHTAAARAVAFSPDGKWLASAGLDGVIMISATSPKTLTLPRKLLDHSAGIDALAWSPDSKCIATGSRDSKVRLHETSGKLVRTYQGLGMEDEPVAGRVPARVLSLAWNRRALVAGTSKGSLYRLSQADDTVTRLELPINDAIYALAFDATGSLLVGSGSRLQVAPAPTRE